MYFSRTAIASGSSAIVKVSGQNCFLTLYGSLGQIRLGPPEGSTEGSTKVLQVSWCLWFSGADPSWAAKRFHQGSTKSLQVLWCLWFSGADPSWAAKRFHQGSSKGAPRFPKVLQVSWCLWFSRALPKGSVLKGSVEGSTRFHQGFTEVPPRFHQGCASFVISLVFWGRSAFGCQKVLWKVPPSLL